GALPRRRRAPPRPRHRLTLFLEGCFAMQSPSTPQRSFHVAIIMDGNGRWGLGQQMTRADGHRAGVEALRRTVEAAPDLGVTTLTVFAFSCDNWRRPAPEVATLIELLRAYLATDGAR